MPKGKTKTSGKGSSSKRSGGSTAAAAMPPLACGMKFLAPAPLAAAVIGKGGATIASLRAKCQARLGLTDHGVFFPTTDCRILTAQTGDEEHMDLVIEETVRIASATADGDSEGAEGEMRLRVLLPRSAAGFIIGKGGTKVRELRERTGATVSISDPCASERDADQVASVSGTAEAVAAAVKELSARVQTLNGELWFPSWLSSTNAAGGSAFVAAPLEPSSRTPAQLRSSSVQTLIKVARALPHHVQEDSRGFALSCMVPQRLVGGLIGRSGCGIKEVQSATGTKIGIREIDDDPGKCSMNISGPLTDTCAAYMLMMKRYLDSEQLALEGR